VADGVALRAPARLEPLDPRVRTLWRCAGAITAVPPLLVVLVLDLVAPHPLPAGVPTLLWAVALGGLVAGGPALRYRRWRYALREDDLWIRQGVVWTRVTVIPYRRIQFVDTRQGPLDRAFGLAQLVVHTAAPGTSGHLPGLDAAEAERLRERLAGFGTDAL